MLEDKLDLFMQPVTLEGSHLDHSHTKSKMFKINNPICSPLEGVAMCLSSLLTLLRQMDVIDVHRKKVFL